MSVEMEEDSKEFIGKLEPPHINSKLDGVERYLAAPPHLTPGAHKAITGGNGGDGGDMKLSNSMHKSNSSNLEQDINLSMEVKKYPSLYDKRDHGYKRNDPSMESWAMVAKACDWIPNAEEACRLFEVLKKRYSKKKMDFRRANYFANSSELMRKTKEELDKYQFMSWMEPHIRHRTVKLGKDSSVDDMYDPDEENEINVVDSNELVVLNNNNNNNNNINNINNNRTLNDNINNNKRKLIPNLNEPNQLPSQVPIVYPVTLRDSRDVADIMNDDVEKDDAPYIIVTSSESLIGGCPRTHPTLEPLSPCIRTVSCAGPTSYNHSDRSRSYENGSASACSKKLCTKQQPLDFGKSSLWKGTYPNYSPLRVSGDYYEQTIPASSSSSTASHTSSSSNQVVNSSTIYQGKYLKDEDELFSEMVLNEVRKLDGKEKCVAKHEIVNVLFNAQLKQYEKKKEEGYSTRT